MTGYNEPKSCIGLLDTPILTAMLVEFVVVLRPGKMYRFLSLSALVNLKKVIIY